MKLSTWAALNPKYSKAALSSSTPNEKQINILKRAKTDYLNTLTAIDGIEKEFAQGTLDYSMIVTILNWIYVRHCYDDSELHKFFGKCMVNIEVSTMEWLDKNDKTLFPIDLSETLEELDAEFNSFLLSTRPNKKDLILSEINFAVVMITTYATNGNLIVDDNNRDAIYSRIIEPLMDLNLSRMYPVLNKSFNNEKKPKESKIFKLIKIIIYLVIVGFIISIIIEK